MSGPGLSMDVVLRPVNDRFLHQVVFPAFEAGVLDAGVGVDRLRQHVRDPHTQSLLDELVEAGVEGSFFGLESTLWREAVYRLLFWEWGASEEGWSITREHIGYAGSLEHTLHLALLVEDPFYPYRDRQLSAGQRFDFLRRPEPHAGLASLVAGSWFPFPAFPPDQVLSTTDRGFYSRSEQRAVADWCHRSSNQVKVWNTQLSGKLERLLDTEARRLSPIELPEREEILDFWRGRLPQGPALAVCFTGLGPTSAAWIREVGALAGLLREAAAADCGLTSIFTRPGRTMADGLSYD